VEKLVKNSAKATTCAGVFAHQRLGHGARAEEMRQQRLGRDAHEVRELLKLCQFADQAHDGGHVGGHAQIVAPRQGRPWRRAADSARHRTALQ
jgi:hypothetical protein